MFAKTGAGVKLFGVGVELEFKNLDSDLLCSWASTTGASSKTIYSIAL